MNADRLSSILRRNTARAFARHEQDLTGRLEQTLRQEGAKTARRFKARVTQHSLVAAAPSAEAAMVALYPTPEQAVALALPNGEPAEILHVTLAFLGEIAPDQAEVAAAVVREVAAGASPLEGTVGGVASLGSETGVMAEVARVAELVKPDGGYGDTAWNPETSTVWWNPADWTSLEEEEAARQAFLALPGVRDVEVVGAESPLPGDPWVVVWRVGGPLVEPSYPSIVLPDVPGLVELRVAVCEALDAAGIFYSRLHGFTAHISLDFTAEPTLPPKGLLGMPLSFDRISVTRGDVPRDFLMGEGALLAAGEPPDWTPPHPDEVFDPEALVQTLHTKSDPVRRRFIEEVGKGLPIDWDVTNPLAGKVLAKSGAKVTHVAETTRLNVMRTIRSAYEQGLSIPDTAALIREGMAAAAPARARLIARTELVAVANGSQAAAAQAVSEATGIGYFKRWLTAPGAKDPRHEDYDGLDGQTVALDEPFDVGGFALMYPGDPDGPVEEIANCRCAMEMVEPEEAQAAVPEGDLVDGLSEVPGDAPEAMSAPTFSVPERPEVPQFTPQEIGSMATDRLWEEMATAGKIENLARADVAAAEEDRLASELWRRPETDLPPKTLRWDDVAGESHLHTVASDGHQTVQEMAEEAIRRGQSQMTVSDHAHLLTPEEIAAQHAEIDRLNGLYGDRFRIYKGIEANILQDGTLDVPNAVLAAFDRVNASLHVEPTLDPTGRLVAATRNPYVSAIGHPHSIDADWDVLARAAKENGVALEVNGRDLLRNSRQAEAASMIAAAKRAGAKIQVGGDAHRAGNLVDSRYAVRFAAKSGVSRDDLVEWQRRPKPPEVAAPPPGDKVSVAKAPFVSPAVVERIDQLGLDVFPPEKGKLARRIFGKAEDTLGLFQNAKGEWSAARAELHDRIIAAHFRGKTPLPADPTGVRRPQAFFTAGGGASGKGSATFLVEPDPIPLPPLTSLNPTGSVFVEYGPEARARAPLGDKITTLDKTMGVGADTTVTIYRGAPASQSAIVPGDFVTTNRQLAKDYAGDGHVIKMEVPASHILDDVSEPLGEEYIYRPPLETKPAELTLAELAERPDVIFMDPDRIKAMFPEFQRMVKGGDSYASNGVHFESTMVGKKVVEQALERGFSVVIDTTGSGSTFLARLDAAAAKGYDVQATMFSIPTNEAISRSVARGDEMGRYLSVPTVKEAHRAASENLAIWKDSSSVGSWRVFDNAGANPELVAEKRGGSVSIHDRKKWEQILAKGDERPVPTAAPPEPRMVKLPDGRLVHDTVSVPGQKPVPALTLQKAKDYGVEKVAEIPRGPTARGLLGDAKDTEALYRGPDGKYPPSREKLYQEAIAKTLEGHTPKPAGEREILVTAGGGASGKSLGLRVNPSLKPLDAVVVNPDDAMALLPEWDRLSPLEPSAAAVLHEEGSYLSKRILEEALEGGYNILLDVVGDDEAGRFIQKIHRVAEIGEGYKVRLMMADAPTNVAIERNIGRASTSTTPDYGRFVPIDVQKQQHRAAINRISDWWRDPAIDEWEIYRTEEVPGTLVARGGGGREPEIVDPEQWVSMMQKPWEEGPDGNPG